MNTDRFLEFCTIIIVIGLTVGFMLTHFGFPSWMEKPDRQAHMVDVRGTND